MKRSAALAAAIGLATALSALPAAAQTKWDLPSAYPANNFHTENLQQFASDVEKGSGGKLKIQLHPNASLFKAPEIKRAVQGNQAQAGEILLVNYENEDALYGLDGIPFLATSYADSLKLYKASKKALGDKLGAQGMMLLFSNASPPPEIYTMVIVDRPPTLRLGAEFQPGARVVAFGSDAHLVRALQQVKEFRHNRRFGHPTLLGTMSPLDEILEKFAQ